MLCEFPAACLLSRALFAVRFPALFHILPALFHRIGSKVANIFALDLVSHMPIAEKVVYSSLDLSNCINSNGDGSKLHMKISKFLTENKIDHENDPRSKFRKYSAFLGKEYCPKPDILIEDRKLVIEINGTRWHADPKKYSPTDNSLK